MKSLVSSKKIQTRVLLAPSSKKGELVEVHVPANLILPASDSSQPFKSVVDQRALTEVEKYHMVRWVGAISASAMGIAVSATFESSTHIAAWDAAFGAGILTFIGLSASAFLTAWRADNRQNLSRQALRRHSSEMLRAWLAERYNLSVNWTQFLKETGGEDFLIKPQQPGSHIRFTDVQQRSFKLVANGAGFYVEEEKLAVYAPSGTVAAMSQNEMTNEETLAQLLSGDAQALHARTIELLATLSKRSLSIEAQHVVKRVREDLRQMLMINRELRDLDCADDEAQAQLAVVLSNLNDELNEVLVNEQTAVKLSLGAQVDYVKERRRTLSGLQLSPTQLEEKAKVVEEEIA